MLRTSAHLQRWRFLSITNEFVRMTGGSVLSVDCHCHWTMATRATLELKNHINWNNTDVKDDDNICVIFVNTSICVDFDYILFQSSLCHRFRFILFILSGWQYFLSYTHVLFFLKRQWSFRDISTIQRKFVYFDLYVPLTLVGILTIVILP